ncbi:hypothetical protein LAZ67_15001709 [Cordylochernes scorpioides]|uniref:Uncharacterized protein n=1 Tax=Cordylochernes scorpioides TaxID=51811 RepID=A0ABY6LBI8_9ARAC|nr:hypothetical protein LAZ67_15001709 [Cordylochernes scorpioides]
MLGVQQVSHWKPEMIEMESEAKEFGVILCMQSAGVMFFVVDKETRSVASMVEAAHVAGAGRKLALVVHELPSIETKPMVLGEQVGERELFELRRGRAYLRDVVERHSIPVFSTLDSALQYTLGLCGRKPSLPATTAHTAGHLQLGDHLL